VTAPNTKLNPPPPTLAVDTVVEPGDGRCPGHAAGRHGRDGFTAAETARAIHNGLEYARRRRTPG
jgi:hypothetical protein